MSHYPIETLDPDDDNGTMPENVHALQSGTTDGYTTWHIYADFGDVMRLKVDWSPGNPFYYGYGFDIAVEPVKSVDQSAS